MKETRIITDQSLIRKKKKSIHDPQSLLSIHDLNSDNNWFYKRFGEYVYVYTYIYINVEIRDIMYA